MIQCPRCGGRFSGSLSCDHCGFSPVTLGGFYAWHPEAAAEPGHFDPSFFDKLASCEDDHFWFRARNKLISSVLLRYASNLMSYLEIGCGTGVVLKAVQRAFPKARCVGTELFVEGLSFAARRVPGAELVQMDARAIPYVQEFDVVAAFDVLEHIREDGQVIAAMYAATKPGGLLLATVPQHPWLWSASDEIGHHVRRYRCGELEEKVRAAGFEIVRSTSFMFLLLPVMAASRAKVRKQKDMNPMTELLIPKWVNFAFACLMAIERLCILAGMDFPIGGSRFVLARRAAVAESRDGTR